MEPKPTVFVSHDLSGLEAGDEDLLARLHAHARIERAAAGAAPLAHEALVEAAAGAEGLLCVLTDRIDARLIAAAPRLRVISTVSVGVDHIDLDAARRRGIAVGHTPGVLTNTTAELALALLLAAARRVAEADRFVRSGAWTPQRRWAPDMMLGRDLAGATLGIVGLGAIGRAVAERARAFGTRVIAWSRSAHDVPGVSRVDLDTLLAESDFVSIHVALTPETHHLIDAAALSRMRRDAILVNTARGPVVDEVALCDALDRGHLGGVGLDVFETEPLSRASRLLAHDRVVVAPHIGSASIATRRRMVALALDNLIAGLTGAPLPHPALDPVPDPPQDGPA